MLSLSVKSSGGHRTGRILGSGWRRKDPRNGRTWDHAAESSYTTNIQETTALTHQSSVPPSPSPSSPSSPITMALYSDDRTKSGFRIDQLEKLERQIKFRSLDIIRVLHITDLYALTTVKSEELTDEAEKKTWIRSNHQRSFTLSRPPKVTFSVSFVIDLRLMILGKLCTTKLIASIQPFQFISLILL